jgi:uncharacterized membrane protein YvbJ
MFCQNCGKPLDKDDKFCTSCGKDLGGNIQTVNRTGSAPFISQEEQKAKDLAITSLAISLFAGLCSFGLLGFIGSIIGHRAIKALEAVNNQSHRGFATAGIVIGYVLTGLSVVGIFFGILLLMGLASGY